PDAMGMAPGVGIASYDWNSDQAEMATHAAVSAVASAGADLYLSNHSYGQILGWVEIYIPPAQAGEEGSTQWYWLGEDSVSEDAGRGQYNTITREWDPSAYNAPYYLIVSAAGNDRDDTPPAEGVEYIFKSDGEWYVKAHDATQ